MPDRLDQQKVDKTVPATTVTDDDPSAPNDSPEKSSNELLAAISRAIFDRIAPVVAGTVTQEGPAELAPITTGFMWLRITPSQMSRLLGSRPEEVDLAAAVALFPDGVRALISARVDARIRVSRSAAQPRSVHVLIFLTVAVTISANLSMVCSTYRLRLSSNCSPS
jgi:hypothetical protein